MVPTIRDVAHRAGVSISTVSRVLNNSAAVANAKRQRVEEAARVLGYSPNPLALGLHGQSTGGIGVLLPYIGDDFFFAFLRAIDRRTSDSGHYLLVSSSHRSESEFRAALRGMMYRVDGLIIMAPAIAIEDIRPGIQNGVPVVFVNSEGLDTESQSINFDNWGGAYRMTEHLIGQGHRHIGLVKGPAEAKDALARLDGFRSALRDHGIEPDPSLEFEGAYTLESGTAAVPAILASDPRPTAIFASNDLSAFGVLSGLRDAGLQVPHDMSLAGFDDIQLARFSSPTLTTVRAPMHEMGLMAVERLLARIDGHPAGGEGAPDRVVELATEVIVRESTADRPVVS